MLRFGCYVVISASLAQTQYEWKTISSYVVHVDRGIDVMTNPELENCIELYLQIEKPEDDL